MSMFDLKGGSSTSWNYSDSSKEGYMESITGTVVEISNPQVLDFKSKKPKFWDDGNPMRQLKVVIQGQSGRELAWYIAGKKSAAAKAVLAALDPQDDKARVSIEDLLGKQVTISTKPGSYGTNNPRPWHVQILGEGDASAVRGLVDLSQPQAQAQPVDNGAANVARQAAAAFGVEVPVTEVEPEQPELYAKEDIPF